MTQKENPISKNDIGIEKGKLFRKCLLEKSGFQTQEELAADCYMDVNAISRRCNGKSITAKDLLYFYDLYGATPNEQLSIDEGITAHDQQDNLCRYSDIILLLGKLINHGVIAPVVTESGSRFVIKDPILKYLYDSILAYSNKTSSIDDLDTWIKGLTMDFGSHLPIPSTYGAMKTLLNELLYKSRSDIPDDIDDSEKKRLQEIQKQRDFELKKLLRESHVRIDLEYPREREIYSAVSKVLDPSLGIPSDSGLNSDMKYWDNAPHDQTED